MPKADPHKAEKQRLRRAGRDFRHSVDMRNQAIRRAARNGLSSREIAAAVGLSHAHVQNIVRAGD